jgi:hypothetical protein
MTIKYLRNLKAGTGTTTIVTGGGAQVLKGNFTGSVSAKAGNMRYYPPAQMTISQIYASVGTTSTSPITADIKVNGVSVLGGTLLTIPANEFISAKRTLTLNVLPTSYITIDVVQGGGSDLVVYIVYEMSTVPPAPSPSPAPSPAPSPPPAPAITFNGTIVFLMSGDGTNNAQNNTFVDSSSNNFTITRSGSTAQGSFSPFSLSAGYWSNYFDGTGDYLTATMTGQTLGSGDFTIECWVWPTGNSQGIFHLATASPLPSTVTGVAIATSEFGFGATLYWAGSQNPSVTSTFTFNAWNHLAVTRSGSTLRVFINGVLNQTQTDSTNYTGASTAIGAFYSSSYGLNGYISNFRVVRNSALYTANFTPSTIPLTAVSGTSLLTCQSNAFADSSTNNFALSATGTPAVSTFMPFSSAKYSTTLGGSAYFNGNGDYITAPTSTAFSFGTGDFTVEGWVYKTSAANSSFIDARPNPAGAVPWAFYIDANNFPYFYDGTVRTSTVSIPLNAWNHIAVTRSSGTLRIFVNGVQGYSATVTTNLDRSAGLFIGMIAHTASPTEIAYYTGYMSNLRIVKGTAVYTAAFTPPTSPVTSTAATSVLLNFTNSGVVDNTGKNDMNTIGDAKVSTTQSKWGNGSVFFDGVGDYITTPPKQDLSFGTGNFTIECWVYPSDVSGLSQRGILQSSTSTGGLQASYSNGVVIYFGARLNGGGNATSNVVTINGGLLAIVNDTVVGSTSTSAIVTANQWSHIALVRNNGTLTLYFNGTALGSVASTANITAQNLCIGGYYNTGYLYNGYLQDLRIVKGRALYTAAFTPPTASLAA